MSTLRVYESVEFDNHSQSHQRRDYESAVSIIILNLINAEGVKQFLRLHVTASTLKGE
jgi:hypothetical protein